MVCTDRSPKVYKLNFRDSIKIQNMEIWMVTEQRCNQCPLDGKAFKTTKNEEMTDYRELNIQQKKPELKAKQTVFD